MKMNSTLSPLTTSTILLVYPIYAILDGFVTPHLRHNMPLFLLHDLAAKLVLPIAMLHFGINSNRFKFSDLSHCKMQPLSLKEWIYYFVVAFVVAMGSGYLGLLFGRPHSGSSTLLLAPYETVLLVVYLSVTAGLFEEIFFVGGVRYLLYNYMRRFSWKSTSGCYIAVSGSLYAIAHFENGLGNVAMALISGTIFAALYLSAGSIWPLVAAHIAIDIFHFS